MGLKFLNVIPTKNLFIPNVIVDKHAQIDYKKLLLMFKNVFFKNKIS